MTVMSLSSKSEASSAASRGATRPWRLVPRGVRPRPGSPLSPLALLYVFAALIVTGAVILSLPACAASGVRTGFLDALFTSASAVCVTGLVVVDTGTHWAPLGQAMVLLLIQVGGFGFMASATLLLLAFGRRIGLRERLLVGETIGATHPGGLVSLIQRMALFAFLAELVGALVLFGRYTSSLGSARGAWFAVFHSVSAFNNAGFDIYGGFVSLTTQSNDPVVVLTILSLLVVGGLSFAALANIASKRRLSRLTLDTRLVLATSGVLILVGTVVYLLAESGNPETMGALTFPQKLMCALFQSATPRTAGFTTVNIGAMHDYTLLFTMFLMFVGGAAGSTAGGIKVNTFGLLIATVVSTLRGREHAEAFGRRFNMNHVLRALAVVLLAIAFLATAILLLAYTEDTDTLSVAFEAVSAFGTVGLSTGITPGLSEAGRVVVIVTMFVGRLGPLYVALALVQRQKPKEYRYPVESVRIG